MSFFMMGFGTLFLGYFLGFLPGEHSSFWAIMPLYLVAKLGQAGVIISILNIIARWFP
jgi:hypothetical protein